MGGVGLAGGEARRGGADREMTARVLREAVGAGPERERHRSFNRDLSVDSRNAMQDAHPAS